MRLKTGWFFPLLLSPFLFAGCGKEEVKEAPPRLVEAVQVKNCPEFEGRTFPGRAEAVQEVNLGFEVGGTLTERSVSKGDQVKKGDLLARLDPRDFANELAAAQAERDRARSHRDRIAEALKYNAVAKQELTDAEASLAEAEARVKIKQKAFADSHIYAPFDGIVAATYVENYQRVQPKEEVLRLLDISKIKFTIDLPENMISYVPYLKDVWVEYDAFPDRKMAARIKEVGKEASQVTRTYPITLIMPQPKGFQVLPGMSGQSGGTAELPGNTGESRLAVPTSAVFEAVPGKESYVWGLNKSARTVHRREVTLGKFCPCGILVKGLKAGDWVAAAGVHSLEEGQKIVFSAAPKTVDSK